MFICKWTGGLHTHNHLNHILNYVTATEVKQYYYNSLYYIPYINHMLQNVPSRSCLCAGRWRPPCLLLMSALFTGTSWSTPHTECYESVPVCLAINKAACCGYKAHRRDNAYTWQGLPLPLSNKRRTSLVRSSRVDRKRPRVTREITTTSVGRRNTRSSCLMFAVQSLLSFLTVVLFFFTVASGAHHTPIWGSGGLVTRAGTQGT